MKACWLLVPCSSWACTFPYPLLTTHKQKLLFRASGEECITINIFMLKTVYFPYFSRVPYISTSFAFQLNAMGMELPGPVLQSHI